MSIKRNRQDFNEDILKGVERLENETEEQHREKHYQFDQILQLQNKQLQELELEQKKQQNELKVKQQQQTNNIKRLLNLNIPFKEKQNILNEQKNNLLKRAKYRQEILDDQPPVEMALKMVLYFQHQHHQDTYNLLLYQHNQLQHAKTRKEQAHLFLEHQQMFLKLFDVQQKVLLQTLIEQQEKAELEVSALKHLTLNEDKDEDEKTIVNERDRVSLKEQINLPKEEDFESLKQLIPSTTNQVSLPFFMRQNSNRDRSHSRSYSQSSNTSTSTTSTKSSPLFTFTNNTTLDSSSFNEKIKDSYLTDIIKKDNTNNVDNHKQKEKEFLERSNKILECKNVKEIKIDAQIPNIKSNRMNPRNVKTKAYIDDFFYKAYQKYRKSKFISYLRADMINDGFEPGIFQGELEDDDDENEQSLNKQRNENQDMVLDGNLERNNSITKTLSKLEETQHKLGYASNNKESLITKGIKMNKNLISNKKENSISSITDSNTIENNSKKNSETSSPVFIVPPTPIINTSKVSTKSENSFITQGAIGTDINKIKLNNDEPINSLINNEHENKIEDNNIKDNESVIIKENEDIKSHSRSNSDLSIKGKSKIKTKSKKSKPVKEKKSTKLLDEKDKEKAKSEEKEVPFMVHRGRPKETSKKKKDKEKEKEKENIKIKKRIKKRELKKIEKNLGKKKVLK